jgi:hypothetical protein
MLKTAIGDSGVGRTHTFFGFLDSGMGNLRLKIVIAEVIPPLVT